MIFFKRAMVAGFLSLSSAILISAQKPEAGVIKIDTVLLNIPVLARDRSGRSVSDLRKEDFSVSQGGEEQSIEYFSGAEEPITAVILIDTSQSVASQLPRMLKVARNFVDTLAPNDQAMIVSFDHEIKTQVGFTSDKKRLRDVLERRVQTTKGDGVDNMFDAVHSLVTKDLSESTGRKMILVLTDGMVGGHRITHESMIDALSLSDVFVYPVFYYVGPSRGFTVDKIKEWPRVQSLMSIAAKSGGRFYIDAAENFDASLRTIAEELRSYYVIGFYPTHHGADAGKLDIRVNRPDITLRTRQTVKIKTANPK